MDAQGWFYVVFALVVAGLFALDLGWGGRGTGLSMRAALLRSGLWISAALLFNLGVWHWRGAGAAMQFFTGYLIELSLSVDNLFVFLMLFGQFGVPLALQHRILFWGILGAILMRVAMILAGATLVSSVHWVLYIFGLFLVVTGARMLTASNTSATAPYLMRMMRRLPVHGTISDGRFFLRRKGKLRATPLFAVLIAVELTDVVFAIDSVPAIFAITTDVFVVLTSNIFAVLGLRSLYFALHGLAMRLRYLKYGLATILILVGAKILLAGWYPIPTVWTLTATAVIIALAVISSLIADRKRPLPVNPSV